MFQDLVVIIIGGDCREVELYRCWKESGPVVKMLGFEEAPEIPEADLAEKEDLERARVLIAPLSGIKENGSVLSRYSPEPLLIAPFLKATVKPVLLLVGSVSPSQKTVFKENIELVLTGEDQELALLNAIPTAEGAIQKAMELSEITLHDSSVLVTGLGRCGTVLARKLAALGCRVAVAVRRREAGALARTMSMDYLYMNEIARHAPKFDFVFNTVPAPVLDASTLKEFRPGTIIIDLASAPGGTDFLAARQRGLKAVLLPGLPGKVAPRSAGRILARVYERIIREKMSI